jgi:hypothetical protein
VLAWTTVDGSFVNDSYPKDADPEPPNVDDKDKFQYEPRSWGYTGTKLSVPTASRRIGGAWDAFQTAETSAVPPDDDAAGWTSLAKVYPEMQDWVARRGHGGAQFWDQKGSIQAIKDLKAKSDIVIVQLHAGFQFQEAASANVRQIAHSAIEAGADLVVCHHPHVVQGLEWYKGKLVAYSLGNFVFDQDFLSTFASSILRTVWEGSSMVEARLVPVEIVDYKPAIVTAGAAASTFERIWERSVLRASTDRAPDGTIVAYVDEPGPDVKLAHFVFEHDTARIVDAPPNGKIIDVDVPAHGTATIPFAGLVDGRLGAGQDDPIFVGRDTFNWGRFEDEVADGAADGATHWDVAGECDKGAVFGDGNGGTRGFLEVRRSSKSTQDILARPVARIPLFRYHLHGAIADGAKPLDPDPSYSVHMAARAQGTATPSIRLDLYHFDDTDPTEDPTSDLVKTIELPVKLNGDGWQMVDLPIDPAALGPTSLANMLFVYVRLSPPCDEGCKFEVDDLALVEWRKAGLMTDRYGAFGFVRNDGATDVTVHAAGWPLAR